MAPRSLIEQAVDPGLRGLAYRFGGSLIGVSPLLGLDDLQQDLALRLLEIASRRPDAPVPDLRLATIDVIRRVLGRGENARVWSRTIPIDEVRSSRGYPIELASIPPEIEIEDPDEETERHRLEWATMGLRERQIRIIESHRALGSSGC